MVTLGLMRRSRRTVAGCEEGLGHSSEHIRDTQGSLCTKAKGTARGPLGNCWHLMIP